MKISKIQTKNRNIVSIEELHALNSAYGKRITKKEIVSLIFLPAIILGLFTFLLTYRWWTVVISIVVGGYFGFKFIFPKVIEKRYADKSLSARNKFMTVMSQSMANNEKTVLACLDYVTFRMDGELREDLKILTETVRLGADQSSIHSNLKMLANKNSEDRIFGQYLQQLETNIFEGNNNIDALHNLTKQHNLMISKRQDFFNYKNLNLNGLRLMIGLMLGILVLFHGTSILMSGDLDMYINGFAKHITSYIVTPIFFVMFSKIMRYFVISYFDDSVVEMQVRTKK